MKRVNFNALMPCLVLIYSAFFSACQMQLDNFVPEEYSFIPILAILAFVITLIVFFLTVGKKEKQ